MSAQVQGEMSRPKARVPSPDRGRQKPRTVDEYLAGVTDNRKRAALQQLREKIQGLVPEAQECLSYGLAAFRVGGKPLVAFGASQHHCAFYPMSPAVIAAHHEDLQQYDTSKGTIRFQADKPLSTALLRRLIRARIAERQ